MKKSTTLLVFILLVTTSCMSQEKSTTINYLAQTRGFLYEISLENQLLVFKNQGNEIQKKLSEEELEAIYSLASKVDFKNLKNNITQEELATDRGIEGVFEVSLQKETFSFKFSHNALPLEIKNILDLLEEISLKE